MKAKLPSRRPVFVLAGGVKQMRVKTRADVLYVNRLFRAAKAYVSTVARDEDVFVLSDKHGLIEACTFLEPYKITSADVVDKTVLCAQAIDFGIRDRFALLIGSAARLRRVMGAFREAEPIVLHMDCDEHDVGAQVAWFDRMHGKLPKVVADYMRELV